MLTIEQRPTLLTATKIDTLLATALSQRGLKVLPSETGNIEVEGEVPDELKTVLPLLIDALGGETISVGTLEFLTGEPISEHYHGPTEFEEVVDWQTYIAEVLKNTTIPEADRWHQASDLPPELQDKVKILSFGNSDIKRRLAEVSDAAAEIMPQLEHFEELPIAEQNRLILLARAYAANIDHVMEQAQAGYLRDLQPNTVGVTLLRGGLRFEEDFPVAEGNRVQVDAKRLPFGEQMRVGFRQWTNLEQLKRLKTMEVAGVDDCGATFMSLVSAIISLKAKAEAGLVPPIEKVKVYLTVATQQGIMDFARHMQELGLDYEIVAGDLAYQLSDLVYIERALGELKPNGQPFAPNQAYVGDMGDILSLAKRELRAA